jgi:predicted kinase
MINTTTAADAPTCIIMIGMGGAGKSTTAKAKFGQSIDILDMDEMKKSIPGYDPKAPQLVHEESSQLFERARFSHLATGSSHVLDTTGKNIEKVARWISDAKSAGFNTHICYVRVSVTTALSRNAKRERVVPADVIIEASGMVEEAYNILAKYADSCEVVNND